METNHKRTPLFPCHVRAGARIVEFGGWEMPVQYTGIVEEHLAVRHAVGIFDISHMGQIFISGANSEQWLEGLLTNRVERLKTGQGHYTLMLNERGGVIDDLLLYRLATTEWLMVVNASKREEDIAWLEAHLSEANDTDGIKLIGPGSDRAGVAIQGPHAPALMREFLGQDFQLPSRNEICCVPGREMFVAATGYTGEEGFEIFCSADLAETVWDALLGMGAVHGIKPCGLGARDTLRLEKCYPLNGSDLSPVRTPLEAGLGLFVDLSKPSFIGAEALRKQKSEGTPSFLRAFKMDAKSPPPRSHYPVLKDGVIVGEVASGTLSPSLGVGIGLAYLPAVQARIGDAIEIDIRGKSFPATIHKKPLYT